MERDSVSRIEIGTRFVTDYELVVLAKIFWRIYGMADRK